MHQIIFAISLVDSDFRPLIIPNNFDPNIPNIDMMPQTLKTPIRRRPIFVKIFVERIYDTDPKFSLP